MEDELEDAIDQRAALLAARLGRAAPEDAPRPGAAAPPDGAPPPRSLDEEASWADDQGPARAFVAWYGELLAAHRDGARALADEQAARAGEGSGEWSDRVLAAAHRAVLEHPIAARAIFAGLVREGRAYSGTDEGRALLARLARSRSVHRAALLWRTVTLGMLAESEEGALPSAYLDALLRVAGSPTLERLLCRAPRGGGA
jgi:hypothetical protein